MTRYLDRALGQIRQFVCSLHGHDALLHFEDGRMSLQCTSCGYETPGWDVKAAPARAALRDTPRQEPARVLQMPLVTRFMPGRRVA